MSPARVFIREPWAGLIVAGSKAVETAAHGLPERFAGRWLAVQTEGRRIVGRVRFSGSFRYHDAAAFDADAGRHMVPGSSPYHFRNRARCYGWVIDAAEAYPVPVAAEPMPGQFRLAE